MKKYPFVSIVVPVYNGERTIAKCIKSLLNLDYPKDRYEIIVVDNNSKDRTREIVEKFPVRLLEEKNKQGCYAALNKGIKNAKGEYIAFIDADEWAREDWLWRMVEVSEEYDMANGMIIPVLDRNNIYELYTQIMEERGGKSPEYFGSGNFIAKKYVFNKAGFFRDDLKAMGDFDFIERSKKFGFNRVFVRNAIVFHRTRASYIEIVERAFRFGRGEGNLKNAKEVFNAKFFKNFLPGIRTYITLCRRKFFSFKTCLGIISINILFNWVKNLSSIMGYLERKQKK